MLFTADAVPGLADGSMTLTFRRWKRSQAKVGGRFRKGDLWFEVLEVDQLPVEDITDADARRAGAPNAAAVRHRLGDLPDGSEVFRVAFQRTEPAPAPEDRADQAELGAQDRADLDRRLDRLDAATRRPWTRAVLTLIAEHPGVVSTVLAEQAGQDRAVFKANVRKLKGLGLTTSLEVGYRLSPRGRAYLDAEPPTECPPGRTRE